MASIIKSDNGVSSGITGIVQSADSSGQLALQTTTSGGTATTAVTIDNTQIATFANTLKAPNLQGPAFSAYKSSNNQSIAASTTTKITFDTKEFDTANAFDSVTNYRFQPTVAGYYQIDAMVTMGNGGTASTGMNYSLSVFKNGSNFKQGLGLNAGGSNDQSTNISTLIYLNGTDYLEIYAACSKAININGNGIQTYFQGSMVRSS